MTDLAAVLAVSDLLETTHREAGSQSISAQVRTLVQCSGLFSYALETDPLRHAVLLRQFYDEIAELEVAGTIQSLADLTRSFDRMEAHQITPSATPILNPGGVAVMTAHKAKGLEFERVYITCLLYTSPSPRDRTRSRMPSSA